MLTLTILIIVYFVPAIVAMARKHNNANAIFMMDLFLGWTLIGWVFALVWAMTNEAKANG